LEKIAWKKINKAIFISELGLDRARRNDLINGKPTKVIYPSINLKRFDDVKPKKGDYFLYVSRFNTPKRQDLLIKAWNIFSKNNPNEKLILAGYPENKKYFKRIKKIAEKSKNVLVKSKLNEEETLELFSNCKAVISVHFMEDFGITPFEALASGKPIIAMDIGGYIELLEKNPQFYKIKEASSKKGLIKEINIGLEKFLKSKIVPKRIIFDELKTSNFIKEFDEAIMK